MSLGAHQNFRTGRCRRISKPTAGPGRCRLCIASPAARCALAPFFSLRSCCSHWARDSASFALPRGFLLAFWLLSMGRAQRFFGSPLGLTILFVYTLALMQYLVIGIRHLIWHFGYGTEPEMRRNMVRATPMAAVLLTSL